jgi:hypothetical protein
MALTRNTCAAATAIAAVFSMLAAPVAAAGLPHARAATVQVHDGDVLNAERSRRHRHRHGGGVDAGDILTGVLILGGIAAIASAADNAREPEPRYPRDDRGYREPAGSQSWQGDGMARAVDICTGEVEREAGPVRSVDGANRNAGGWQVSGELDGGRGFSCWIGNDGRVSGVDVQDGAASYDGAAYEDDGYEPAGDAQWSDGDYARARAGVSAPASHEVVQATGY